MEIIDKNTVGSTGAPIAIGGVGGSGTRVVAGILHSMGVNIGDDLNDSLDNLAFTLLFKDRRILTADEEAFSRRWRLFRATYLADAALDLTIPDDLVDHDRPGTGPVQQDRAWLMTRKTQLEQQLTTRRQDGSRLDASSVWGWKEPNTHIVLDRLFHHVPGLRYIHVVRNGIDMALSDNQNQLHFWGRYFLSEGRVDPEVNAANSLAYWVRAEERVRQIANQAGERFLEVRFEDLCHYPRETLVRLFDFCCLSVDDAQISHACSMIRPPDSLNRGRTADLAQFAPDDLAWLEKHGYSC